MDLLKKYGPKELARISNRERMDKKKKRERDVNYYIADRMRAHYLRMNDSRKKLRQF